MNDDHDGVPIMVVVILVVTVAAALALTNLMQPGDDSLTASFPPAAGDLPVITVADAVAVRDRDDSTGIAVAGWFQQPLAVPCPFPGDNVVDPLEGRCETAMTWLMAEPESLVHMAENSAGGTSPESPAINPVFDGPGTEWARPLPDRGDSVPTPVVLVGHFDDPRAADCQPENRKWCLDQFVVTDVAWADGVDYP